jgi:hypothetical protein
MTVTGPGDEQCCIVPVPVERVGYVPNERMIRQPVDGREEMMVYVIGPEELGQRGKALICVYGRLSFSCSFFLIYPILLIHALHQIPKPADNTIPKDIFGIHPSTLRGADFLSSRLGPGFQIYVPDIFRGKGWKTDNIPPREGRAAMQTYIKEIGCGMA